jgi:hypothetical protein
MSVPTFSIIIPQGTTNLLTNPSCETGTTHYAAYQTGTTIAQSTNASQYGVYSLVCAPSSNVAAGMHYYVTGDGIAFTSGQDYTWTFSILAEAGIDLIASAYNFDAPGAVSPYVAFTANQTWQRIQVTWTQGSIQPQGLLITKNSNASVVPFYVDGMQLEALPYATSYCDGDEDGCTWTGKRHASTSQRSSQYSLGGRKVDLQQYGAYLVSQGGTGMPPIRINSSPHASHHGSHWSRSLATDRHLTITFSLAGNDLTDLHARRQELIDLMSPDTFASPQPFRLLYDEGGRELSLDCVYESGLEMTDGKNEIETIGLRIIAHDPFWYSLVDERSVLSSVATSVGDSGVMRQNTDGSFTRIGLADGTVLAIAVNSSGDLYVGGHFVTMEGVSASKIAKWTKSTQTWSAIGSGFNGAVWTIAIDVDDTVYVGGEFTQTGGTPCRHLAKITTAGTISEYGNANNTVYALDIDRTQGYLLVGGAFTTIDGNDVKRIGLKYILDSSTFQEVDYGVNDVVYAVAADGNRYYYGGAFTASADGTITGLPKCAYTITGSSHVVTTGLPGLYAFGNITSIFIGNDGLLYITGQGVRPLTSPSGDYVVTWNGAAIEPLGTGFSGTSGILCMTQRPTGQIVMGGASRILLNSQELLGFTTVKEYAGLWHEVPITADCYALACDLQNTLYIGLAYPQFPWSGRGPMFSGTTLSAATTTVVNSGGTDAYLVIRIINTSTDPTYVAHVARIENKTNNTTLYFDRLSLRYGETVIMDLRSDKKTVTSYYRQTLLSTILPDSDLSTFRLSPGTNLISVFTDSSILSVVMYWRPAYWSIDSTAT